MLAACGYPHAGLAPAVSQPDTRPTRNFTSFSDSLRCMDGLLARLPPQTYLISSSDILDETRRLSVGADDMLINAINQINRSSRRYVFLDQARISGFGQLEIVTTRKEDELKPNLYIRGSISQLDSDVAEGEVGTVTANRPRLSAFGGLTSLSYKGFRKLSVVSVDLHLVRYPSRQIVPGASVANSMVVVRRGFSGRAAGIIDTLTIGIPISIERVESQSQAVRNLVELGVIELLGKHSGVPYWQCLDAPATDARRQQLKERNFVYSLTDRVEVSTAQTMLIDLGYLSGPPTGRLDATTKRAISRFQAKENLLPNGILDFDLMERLSQKTQKIDKKQPEKHANGKPTSTTGKRTQTKVKPAVRDSLASKAVIPSKPVTAAPGQSPTCKDGQTCDGIYKNLYDFIKEDVGF